VRPVSGQTHTAAERAAAAEDERCHQRIASALAPGALTMIFKPVVDLITGGVVGAEALARFSCAPEGPPTNGSPKPSGSIVASSWNSQRSPRASITSGSYPSTTFLAVYPSPRTAAAPDLNKILDRLPAEHVVLELTEHSRVTDHYCLLGALDRHRQRGVRIAVDDTGAGYAGLQHLVRIAPTSSSSISHSPRASTPTPYAAALVTFASETGATIIAEGVETPLEVATLRRLGIPSGPGYHLAHPACHYPRPRSPGADVPSRHSGPAPARRAAPFQPGSRVPCAACRTRFRPADFAL
jgi:EAL domain-containing protein (putative c-di-GMP-specific phosphodiesterase class I)